MVHISFLSLGSKITTLLAQKSQIASVLIEKVTVPAKYSDFANVFSKKLAKVHPEQTGVNEHAIELEEGKQPPYRSTYSLGAVEF